MYGTTNVRVGDISIVPLHVSAHTQSELLSETDANRLTELYFPVKVSLTPSQNSVRPVVTSEPLVTDGLSSG